MQEIKKEVLETILRRFYRQNILAKVINFNSEGATSKGDNFTSSMKRIRFNVVLNSGKESVDSVIIKELPHLKYSRETWIKTGIFPIEISVYRDILPAMESVMAEVQDFTEPLWPKCIDFTANEKIILEDLTKYGYKMVKRKQALNWDHCVLVMKSLAKFHAISVIVHEKRLINLNIFGEHIYQRKTAQSILNGLIKDYFRKLTLTMEKSWGTEWARVIQRLRTEFAPNVMSLLSNLMKLNEKRFNVLCHGDCWINNMMFKYSIDHSTPISLKFVDFQNTFYNSPAFDLRLFLATSPNLEVRYSSYDRLIEIYYNALVKELSDYEYRGSVITLNKLKEEYERVDLYGLVAEMSILPVVLLEDSESLPDMEDVLRCAAENEIEKIEFNPFEKAPDSVTDILKDTLKQMFPDCV
uniref:CHK domain-containing protein n=5 Tax=Rhodnius TaxID=13248 RepID=T1HHK6_RHOPR